MNPIRLLVDNMIRSYANIAQTIRVPVPGFGNRLLLIQAKPARSANEKWLQSQIEALPTIARLAREKRIALTTYIELDFEFQRRKTGFPANLFGDVFAGVSIAGVTAPIERPYFFQEDMSAYARKKAQTEFCSWLLSIESLPVSDEWKRRIGPEQFKNFQRLDRYREICHSLHPSQFVDAFHLWTGEVNGIEGFLTTDGTLVRALGTNRDLQLKCRPVFPTDLLDALNVKERDPLPFQYGRRYTLNGIPYD